MHFKFFAADKHREKKAAAAFHRGIDRVGHTMSVCLVTEEPTTPYDHHMGIVVGVKGKSARIIQKHKELGIPFLYVDKGFFRLDSGKTPYYKFSFNDFQPTDYLMRIDRPSDRLQVVLDQARTMMDLDVSMDQKIGQKGDLLLLYGMSLKNAMFHNLGDPTRVCSEIVDEIRYYLKRSENGGNWRYKLGYYPKYSWHDAVSIPGTEYLKGRSLSKMLHSTAFHITHNSGSSFMAVLMGVPVIVLGNGIAAPIAHTDLSCFKQTKIPTYSQKQRLAWLRGVSYCQWTMQELEEGEAFHDLLHTIWPLYKSRYENRERIPRLGSISVSNLCVD